jgi:hypothetical protein
LEFLGFAGAEGVAHAGGEAADFVGVGLELVLLAGAADVGGLAVLVLKGLFDGKAGAGGFDDRFGVGDLVQQDGVGGVENPRGGFWSAHPFEGLGGQDDGGAVGAHGFDHARDAFAVGDGRELVDDQQHVPALCVACGEELLEVLDQEPPELRGLFAVEQLVEQQVAGVGVFEGPGPVELAVGGVEEGGIALAAGVDVL